MRKLLFNLAALPFLAGVAFAAEPLSDPQMDRLTAGACAYLTCLTIHGLICMSSTTGFLHTNCAGPVVAPSYPATVINDLQHFFKVVPVSPADISADSFQLPLFPLAAQ